MEQECQECIELIPGANHYVVPMEKETIPSDFVDLNTYYYRLINGQIRLKGIALRPGWELRSFKTENLSCYEQRGEDTMARYNWNELWPKVLELQAKGKSVTDIATELGIERKVLTSKIYREKNKQTPTPEPDELGGTDPEREEPRESAGDSVLDNNEQRQTEDDKAIVAHMRYAFSELFGAPDDGGFTAADEEPIPYQLVETILEHHHVADEIAELLDQKRADYGTENIKKFGSYGVLVRVSDKVERLINLSRKEGQVNFESVEDSWKDIAGYAILALIELREGR